MTTLKVVSLFSGVGGLDYGFAKLGCEIVFANDFNRFACETYRHNFNRIFGNSDHLVEGDILKNIDKIPMNADLLLAGAPCQAWSMAGNRKGFDDIRGSMLLKTVDILKEKQPRFFIWENVQGLMSHDDGRSFERVLQMVNEAGYDTQYSLLNFSEFGVSQRRKRVIIWGKRRDQDVDLSSFMPEYSSTPASSLGKFLRDNEDAIKASVDHIIYEGSNAHKDFGKVLLPGENVKHVNKQDLRRRFEMKGLKMPDKIPGGFRPVYRLSPYEVAPTMVFNGGTNVPYHPWEDRCLSVAETSLIQGFPADFEFKGGLREQYKQIANAVPPAISMVLAKAFVSALSE